MTRPFRVSTRWSPTGWPELEIVHTADCLAIRLGKSGAAREPASLKCLSSAVLGGGLRDIEAIVNWKVPLTYMGVDPREDLRLCLAAAGFDPSAAAGLMTAASLTDASVQDECGDAFRLAVCTTSGTGNAATAGLPRDIYPSYRPGTINIAVLVDGRMTEAAMVNAVLTATEAKAAALQALDIRDRETGRAATGTTTDAIAIAVTQSPVYGLVHEYAGCAASIGNAIGRLVYASVLESAGARAAGAGK